MLLEPTELCNSRCHFYFWTGLLFECDLLSPIVFIYCQVVGQAPIRSLEQLGPMGVLFLMQVAKCDFAFLNQLEKYYFAKGMCGNRLLPNQEQYKRPTAPHAAAESPRRWHRRSCCTTDGNCPHRVPGPSFCADSRWQLRHFAAINYQLTCASVLLWKAFLSSTREPATPWWIRLQNTKYAF